MGFTIKAVRFGAKCDEIATAVLGSTIPGSCRCELIAHAKRMHPHVR
jgi:hypothetical protein